MNVQDTDIAAIHYIEVAIVVSDKLSCEDFVVLGADLFWRTVGLHSVAVITVKPYGSRQPDDTGRVGPDVIDGHA